MLPTIIATSNEEFSKPANPHRDRNKVLNFIGTWSEEMFERQFRLSRDLVRQLIILIQEMSHHDEELHYKYVSFIYIF